ncbi:MAG: hypothetical protein LBT09_13950 [Planctomycetaceae bacterium]|jgi:hypothetical protein|nr:hypothetical protein [Planctomycetaceae bacterium]
MSYCNTGIFCPITKAQEISPHNTTKGKTITTTPEKSESETKSQSKIKTKTETKPTTLTSPPTPPQHSPPQSTSPNQQLKRDGSSTEISGKVKSPNKPPIILQVPKLTAMEHSWGRFAPSSWRRMQTTIWTINAGRRISNVSETKTVLSSVDDESVTLLEIAATGTNTETDGAKPVKKYFDFYNIALGEGMKITNAEPMKIVIDGRILPCERRIYEQTTPTVTRKITVWYSTQIYPYVMRIERTVKNIPNTAEPEIKILSQSTFEVTDSSAFRLLTSKQGTYRTKIIKRSGDVTTVTDSYCSLHVPGGLIRENTQEFDGAGNMIRSIETRLLNYYYLSLPPAIIVPNNTAAPNQPLIIQYEPVRPRWLRSYRLRAVPYQYYTD